MPDVAKAYVFLVITTLGWGANAVVAKMAVGHIAPLSLTLLRWTLALLFILVISVPQLRRDWPELRRHWLLLLSYGLFGFAGFNALLYTAVKHTTAINVAIEQAGIPGLIFIANFVLFRTHVTFPQIAGFSLTLMGVILAATHGSVEAILHLDLNIGDAMMLGAVVLYAIYTVSLRYKPAIHWKSLMAASAAGAVLASLPMAGYEFAQGEFIAPDMLGWFAVVFTAIVPSLISQILYVRGVELIGPNRAGLFINAIPVWGTLLSVIFLHEEFRDYHLQAMVMVLGGIAIAERVRR